MSNKNCDSSDDYDSPWKEALEIYFKDFMEFLFPWIADEIDWTRAYKFRDKEFQQIVRDAKLGRHYADKLVSVWSNQGDEIKVMIHIDFQLTGSWCCLNRCQKNSIINIRNMRRGKKCLL